MFIFNKKGWPELLTNSAYSCIICFVTPPPVLSLCGVSVFLSALIRCSLVLPACCSRAVHSPSPGFLPYSHIPWPHWKGPLRSHRDDSRRTRPVVCGLPGGQWVRSPARWRGAGRGMRVPSGPLLVSSSRGGRNLRLPLGFGL